MNEENDDASMRDSEGGRYASLKEQSPLSIKACRNIISMKNVTKQRQQRVDNNEKKTIVKN